MRIAFFSARPYDRDAFSTLNGDRFGFDIEFFEPNLSCRTMRLVEKCDAVCAFINDDIDRDTIECLKEAGCKLILLRSAGFNNVDLKAAADNGIRVARVPAYSPYAVAEHASALVLALNRQIHRAHNRVRERNFQLTGLMGFDLNEKTVGICGTGKIGVQFGRIMKGFGCKLLGFDPYPNDAAKDAGIEYVDFDELLKSSRIISLHAPLTPQTHHMINGAAIHKMQDGVMLINTSRGGLIDTAALIDGLKSRKIGSVGLDVYEEESHFFFEDLSDEVIDDDQLARLLSFPNVLMTSHQAWFTREALTMIAETTLQNAKDFEDGKLSEKNEVKYEKVKK